MGGSISANHICILTVREPEWRWRCRMESLFFVGLKKILSFHELVTCKILITTFIRSNRSSIRNLEHVTWMNTIYILYYKLYYIIHSYSQSFRDIEIRAKTLVMGEKCGDNILLADHSHSQNSILRLFERPCPANLFKMRCEP